LNSTKTIAGFEDMSFFALYPYGFYINEATECEITMAQSTVEDVRDGILPEGLISGMILFKGDYSVMLSFGVLRRPSAAAAPNDRISRDSAHQASVSREEGYYVVFGSTGGYEAGTLFGSLPIPATLTGDVVLKAVTTDGSSYTFYADGVEVAQVALNAGVIANALGFTAQNFSDTASFIPQFSGITFAELRMEGSLIGDRQFGLDTSGDAEVASDPPAGATELGDRIRLGVLGAQGAVNFSWRRNGAPLSDTGRIAGTAARILVIDPAEEGDAGAYTCEVDDGVSLPVETSPYALEFVEVPTALEPYNPVAAGELPQYVFFWKANWSGNPLTVDYCNEITQAVGEIGHSRLRIGVSITLDILEYSAETMIEWLEAAFAACEQTGLPLLIQLDGQNHWSLRPDLWNWWDPGRIGYDPENADNVEWYGWGPEYATKIAWRNWGNQQRIPPAPNLASFAFLAAHWEKYRDVIPVIVDWYEGLPANRKYLFGGVKVGWECAVITNSFYFPNGNWYLENYPDDTSHDPTSGYGPQYGWTWGVEKTGYAAAATMGIKTSGELTKDDHEEVVRDYLNKLSRVAVSLGMPHHLLFTHQGAFAPWDQHVPFDPAINGYSIPGYSFYQADPPDTPLATTLDAYGRSQFSNAEVYWRETSTAAYKTRFENSLNPFQKSLKQCRNVVIYAWELLQANQSERENMTGALRELIEETQPTNPFDPNDPAVPATGLFGLLGTAAACAAGAVSRPRKEAKDGAQGMKRRP